MGNLIAQLIIKKCYDVKFVDYKEWPDTQCSVGGFGSSLGFKKKKCIHLIARNLLEKVFMQLKIQLTNTIDY